MALINCPECNKQISDKADSCPNCGNPMKSKVKESHDSEEYLACPKCLSKDLHSEKAGFSGGKAVAGAVLTGGIGLLAGTIGSNKVKITCLKCGNKFKAGEAKIIKSEGAIETINNRIVSYYRKTNSKFKSVQFYKDETNCSLEEANRYVNKILSEKLPPEEFKKSNSGCMVLIVFLLALGTILFSML